MCKKKYISKLLKKIPFINSFAVIEIVVVSVNKNLIFNIILLVVAIILLVIYMVHVIVDERKKWKQREFFKYTIKYEIDYFLYFDMVKK